MSISPVQYLVAEDGQRVGVVLKWEDYRELQLRLSADADLLNDMADAELQALAEGMLGASYQQRLDDLLQRNASGILEENERCELDGLLERIDHLNMLKARALYTLKSRASVE